MAKQLDKSQLVVGGLVLFGLFAVFGACRDRVALRAVEPEPIAKADAWTHLEFEVNPYGYELAFDDPSKAVSCVYVRGLTDGHLRRLQTDLSEFKKALKRSTGYKCVFLVE